MAKGLVISSPPEGVSPERIGGRYEVLARAGLGLTGEVYKVRGPEGIAALKLLKKQIQGLPAQESVSVFKFEFSLLKGLNHPHIIQIFDFGCDEKSGRFYFTEEWVEGISFHQLSPKTPLATLQSLFIQALQGLAYLHGQGVIHGDLKPENLLIQNPHSSSPLLKIIDFGISHPHLIQTGGTPLYMAPEKILKEPLDARSDLYSLATAFYTVIAGENPFVRKNIFAILRAHLHFNPPSAMIRRPKLDPVFSEILDLMLKKNPRHRIASAEACLKFLETRGEFEIETARLHSLPDVWIGRDEILKEAHRFLDEIAQTKQNRLLGVIGSRELGLKPLLAELKYEAELKGIEVVFPEESDFRGPSVIFINSTESSGEVSPLQLREWLKKASVVWALPPEQEAALFANLADLKPLFLRLRPLTQKETETYLQEITRQAKIPLPFLSTLYQVSRGYPNYLIQALRNLLKDSRLVDPSGKWQLAVFEEAPPDFEGWGASEDCLSHALEGDEIRDPEKRWSLHLSRAEALAQQSRWDGALKLLEDLEKDLKKVFPSPQRFVERARLLEKRGWIYSKQEKVSEARGIFSSALSLLKESENPSAVLELRLKNFLAYLDLREGRFAESIAQFEENARRARELSPIEQRRITNNELGNAYLAAGKIREAIARLQEDVEFFSALADPFLSMKAAYNLGEAYTADQDYARASFCYTQVAELARKERNWEFLLRAYNGLGNVCSLQKKLPPCLDYYQQGLAIAEYLRDFLSAATVAQNRGVILNELGRLDEALEDLNLSKHFIAKVHPSSHTRRLMARVTLELGEVYRKKRDYPRAKSYFTEALSRAEEDPHLKPFRFYPLASLAGLALEEKEIEAFRSFYPKLLHWAQSEEEKKILTDLVAEASASGGALTVSETAPSAFDRTTREHFQNILKLNRALLTEQDPRFLLKKILEYAAELSGAETALLLEKEENGAIRISESFNTEVDSALREISHHTAERVFETGKSVISPDAQVDSDFNQFHSVVSLHLRSIACIPIRVREKVVGLLYLTHRYKTNLFSPERMEVLEAYGDQAGLAWQNMRHLEALKGLNGRLQEELREAEEKVDQLKVSLRSQLKNHYPAILGQSEAILKILQIVDRVSETNLSVVILGETGVGKELIARALHENSRRHKGPFVAVNCGAIPETLIESELFGYRAGAFTGALRDKKGLLEEAHEGTLFLDEIADLPLNTQVKLLRVLEEKTILRLGETKGVALDLRVAAATHRNLEEEVRKGRFREDLYYRLAEMVISLPPLRERREDVMGLAEHFLKESAKELERSQPLKLGKDVYEFLMTYEWPGNVRELENFLRTASAFADRGVIRLANLPEFLRKKLENPEKSLASVSSLAQVSDSSSLYQPQWTWRQYEEVFFAQSLLKHQMNCQRVAEDLRIGIATVYLKMRKYGFKKNIDSWRDLKISWTGRSTLEVFKKKVIEEVFLKNEKRPYAVARELHLNIGTVYRYLQTPSV